MQPMIEELLYLQHGEEEVFNSYTKRLFTLKAHLILVSGDGPASAKAMGFANPGNAKSPCHQCKIKATAFGRHYYVPHTPQVLDKLPLREGVREQIKIWANVKGVGTRQEMSTLTGITRESILLELNSLHFPRSFPFDPMHGFLLNVGPSLYNLWSGGRFESDDLTKVKQKYQAALKAIHERATGNESKDEDSDEDMIGTVQPDPPEVPPYVLSKQEWTKIGDSQERSRKMIPQALGQGPRRIDKHSAGYKAKEWEALLIRDGPILLHGIPGFEAYYDNYMVFREIYQLGCSWSISTTQIERIKTLCVDFVRRFESLYYQDDATRLKVCRINNHSILHLGK